MQGALQHMGEPELQHWMRLACCRTLVSVAQAAQRLVQDHGKKPDGQQVGVQVRIPLVATAVHVWHVVIVDGSSQGIFGGSST